jgi:hypothetical protein
MEQKAERDRILAARRELLSESQQEALLEERSDGSRSPLADLTADE